MTIEFVVNLENHKRRIWSICWSPDGNFLASVGADKYITIWIKTNKDKIKKTKESSKVWKKFKMFEEGTHKSGNIEFDIYDIIETNHEKSLRHIEFSRDGSFFVVASFDSKCSIYKKNNNDKWVFYKSLEGHEKEVKCASIHPTNKYIVTCGRDKSIWIHAKTDEVSKKDDEHGGSAANGGEALTNGGEALTNGGEALTNGGEAHTNGGEAHTNGGEAHTNGDEAHTNGEHNEEQVKEDSQNAVQTDVQCGNSGKIHLNGEPKKANNHFDVDFDFNFDAYLTAHSEDIKFVAWCPLSENTFISLSYDNSLKIWSKQISEWNCVQTLNEHTSVVWCVAFNFDGSEFATCSDDKSIRIWKSEKKVWYNKHKYPFLYQHIVKDARKSSNESSLWSFINKSNGTMGGSVTGMKKVLTNDNRGYSNHNSKHSANGKGSNDRNFLDKTKNLFRKIKEPKIQGVGEKTSDGPSNFPTLDYSKEDKEVQAALKAVVQNNFVPLYFDHGLFKFVYKYADVEGGKEGACIQRKASAEKREEQGSDPQKESPSGARLIAKKELNNELNNALNNELNSELNNEPEKEPKNEPEKDECISKVSKDGVDQANTHGTDIAHKNESDDVSELSNEEKTNKQSGCTTTQDEQQTSNPVSENNVSSMNIIPNLSDKEKDLKNVSFDDWKIKHVIEGYHKRSISYLDWNAYEDLIAASSFDNSLKIFQKNLDTWNLIENIENAHLSDVNCVVWCPQKYQDYFLLATAGDDCVINIWKYTKG
ncbi:WD domain G-beta repeat domain containing protein [Plasmodium cynomolgi strain B]|uniref:Probable cytosolic iron-sulfur protein assembly protein CIAO1 homolog n=1 Tax=Plasmodium cynomolgi (strain B) TaxID=1120755 RepID=K6UZZ0_PLACD|nr:WD domain G-beta repeat domain containing protein [Plasmodium cynomolgi strain B]GAB68305.1 WD domain G-beta repeat domain containing protein [Plasmodium cynomolgi strain B]